MLSSFYILNVERRTPNVEIGALARQSSRRAQFSVTVPFRTSTLDARRSKFNVLPGPFPSRIHHLRIYSFERTPGLSSPALISIHSPFDIPMFDIGSSDQISSFTSFFLCFAFFLCFFVLPLLGFPLLYFWPLRG